MKLDEELLRKKKLEQQLEAIQAEIQEIAQRQKKPAIQTMVETIIVQRGTAWDTKKP